jgi:hypothetical protein
MGGGERRETLQLYFLKEHKMSSVINYHPLNKNYPVQRADQQLSYVNYLVVSVPNNSIYDIKNPTIRLYNPSNGTPTSAIAECKLRSNFEKGSLGYPVISRETACVEPLRWTERRSRDLDKIF